MSAAEIQPEGNTYSMGKPINTHDTIKVLGEVRWLQDPHGRLLYIGVASSLSFLSVVRAEVGVAMKGSPSSLGLKFAEDEMSHKIPRSWMGSSDGDGTLSDLPDRQSAATLAEYFFTGTSGLLEILDRHTFEAALDLFYQDPSSTWDPDLCLIYLVLANGLVMTIPGQDDTRLSNILADPRNFADLFYETGKHVAERVPGFGDGDIWSIQARTLMALYSFHTSNWSVAYEHLNSATTMVTTLGFHHEQPFVSQNVPTIALRRHIWRSIYVLDRLISEFVDISPAIRDCDFPAETLGLPREPPKSGASSDRIRETHLAALDAVVTATRSMRHMIESSYGKDSVSTHVGHSVLKECGERLAVLPRALKSIRFLQEQLSPAEGLAVLYVNMVDEHCKLLLTRPFFLHIFVELLHSKRPATKKHLNELERLAQTCVNAAMGSVSLMYRAYRSQWLPRRNAFLLNFMFAASLVIMCNELVSMFPCEQYMEVEGDIRTMAASFATPDPQGQMVWATLSSLGDLVQEQRRKRTAAGSSSGGTAALTEVAPIPWGPGSRSGLAGISSYPTTAPRPIDSNSFMQATSGNDVANSASIASSVPSTVPLRVDMQPVVSTDANLSDSSFTNMGAEHLEPPQLTRSLGARSYAPVPWIMPASEEPGFSSCQQRQSDRV